MSLKNIDPRNHSSHLDSTIPGIPTFKEVTYLVAVLLSVMIFSTLVITIGVSSKFYVIKKDQITKQQWVAIQSYLFNDKNSDSSMQLEQDSDKMMTMMKSGSFVQYNASELIQAKIEGHSVVIFFNSSDSIESRDIVDNLNANKNKIPETLHILNTSYENQLDLKIKYEITAPNTFVKVDSGGKLIKKTTGLKSLEDILTFVK